MQGTGSVAITSDLNSYHAIKIIGHCFDSGRVLLATTKESNDSVSKRNKLVAVKQYSLEHCHRDIGLFLKVPSELIARLAIGITILIVGLTISRCRKYG